MQTLCQRDSYFPIRCNIDVLMDLFYSTTDELDTDGIPVKTRAQLLKICNSISDYAVNYVNEPSIGLWFIQNHLHDKILPRNAQIKSDLLLALQESREVLLDLEGSMSSFPRQEDSTIMKSLDETVALARDLQEKAKIVADKRAENVVVNKTLDTVLKESPAKQSLVKKLSIVLGSGETETETPEGEDFEQWYKSKFKA